MLIESPIRQLHPIIARDLCRATSIQHGTQNQKNILAEEAVNGVEDVCVSNSKDHSGWELEDIHNNGDGFRKESVPPEIQ